MSIFVCSQLYAYHYRQIQQMLLLQLCLHLFFCQWVFFSNIDFNCCVHVLYIYIMFPKSKLISVSVTKHYFRNFQLIRLYE